MSEEEIFKPSSQVVAKTLTSPKQYQENYEASIADPDKFWGEQAKKRLDWIKPFTKVKNTSFDKNYKRILLKILVLSLFFKQEV